MRQFHRIGSKAEMDGGEKNQDKSRLGSGFLFVLTLGNP